MCIKKLKLREDKKKDNKYKIDKSKICKVNLINEKSL